MGSRISPRQVEAGIWTTQPRRVLHHQLRIARPFHVLEARVAGFQVAEAFRSWGRDAIAPSHIVNFALDGGFLSRVFPGVPLTTVIHDDFEAQSRLPFHGHITVALRETCRASDRVLAVSAPLVERLSEWCRSELLLPWAQGPYKPPIQSADRRDVLLFWGYVDNALDLDVLRAVSSAASLGSRRREVMLVGPTQTKGARARIARALGGCGNVSIKDPTSLDDLPLDRVLCALLPYRRSRAVDSVTLANKSMQLLCKGLPLAISGMPRFLQRPFIVRLDGPKGPGEALERCEAGFQAWQPAIREFCEWNSAARALELVQPPAR
jgi:hypothetical protein